MRERTKLETGIKEVDTLFGDLSDTTELIDLAEAEDDADVLAEAEATMNDLLTLARKAQLKTLLSGEADENDCFMQVQAGAGGTEAQDWAEMLLRMYTRWAEQHGMKVEWLEESAGEEAGIKSATIRISGENAYGWLKTESGVHRLVRISPYDSSARRHTSFASAWISPVIDDNIDVEIDEKISVSILTVHLARVVSTLTRLKVLSASRTDHLVSWYSVKMIGRSIRTAHRP